MVGKQENCCKTVIGNRAVDILNSPVMTGEEKLE